MNDDLGGAGVPRSPLDHSHPLASIPGRPAISQYCPASAGQALAVDTGPRRRTLARRCVSLVIGSAWLITGGCISTYAGLLIYRVVSRLEVDSAVVAGAVEPLKAPASGRLTMQAAEVGQAFGSGEVLFKIQNPQLDQSISMQRVTVERAQSDLVQAEATLANEHARRDSSVLNQRGQIEKSEALVALLGSQVALLSDRCAELAELYRQGFTQSQRLHDAQDKLVAARIALAQTRIDLQNHRNLLALSLSGQGANGIEVIGHLAEATAALARSKAELTLANDALQVLLKRREEATFAATGPGRVLRVLRLSGAQVQAGDTVAVIERDQERFIYAYVTQAEVGRLARGDAADVFLPAQRLSGQARITAIERAGAYLDDVETRYDWRANRDNPQRLTDRDRTARLTLRFNSQDSPTIEHAVDVGTPVVLSLPKHWHGLMPRFESVARNQAGGSF